MKLRVKLKILMQLVQVNILLHLGLKESVSKIKIDKLIRLPVN